MTALPPEAARQHALGNIDMAIAVLRDQPDSRAKITAISNLRLARLSVEKLGREGAHNEGRDHQ